MKQTKAQILELIKDKEKGDHAIDKLRLFIVWFLTTEAVVADKPEKAAAAPAGGDGGMGGMDF